MAKKATPFGNVNNKTPVDHATLPTVMMTQTGTGGFEASPIGIVVVATAPNWDPSLIPGRPTTVFVTADSKIYVWTTGTTWVKTGALT